MTLVIVIKTLVGQSSKLKIKPEYNSLNFCSSIYRENNWNGKNSK